MTRSACQAPIVACALLLCVAEGLRRPRRHSTRIVVRSKGVPRGRRGQDLFRKVWEDKRVAEEQSVNLTQPLPKSLRVILGVPTIPEDGPYRAVIRDTWMRQPQVCGIEMVPKPTCVIYAGFLFGNATREPILRNGDLHFQLAGPESSLGEGTLVHKMFLFWQFTSRTFTWATHIVRIDTDFYPHFHLMLPSIQKYHAQGRDMEYLGEPIRSHSCGADMSDIQAARDQKRDYCLVGALLILSPPLAFAISNNFSEYFDAVRNQSRPGNDDRLIGHVVTEFVRRTRMQVTVADQGIPGWDHADRRLR